jgi:CubicO group peptidase (beta-lactamase class C family)
LASDDLLTTVRDYGAFAAALLRGGVLSPRLLGELPRGAVGAGDLHMGLGLQIVEGLPDGRAAWLHTGADEGVRALVMLDRANGDGIVILTNGDRGGDTFTPLVSACLRDGSQIIERLERG